MLQRFPNPAEMPCSLVFLLARNLADAGRFEQASALFRNRSSERSESGVDVRRVYLEIKLREAQNMASQGNCKGALAALQAATKAKPDVAFSSENLEDVVQHSRELSGLQSSIQQSCRIDLGRH